MPIVVDQDGVPGTLDALLMNEPGSPGVLLRHRPADAVPVTYLQLSAMGAIRLASELVVQAKRAWALPGSHQPAQAGDCWHCGGSGVRCCEFGAARA